MPARKAVYVIVVLLTTGAIAGYFWHNSDQLARVAELRWPFVALLVALSFAYIFAQGLLLMIVLWDVDIRLSFKEWFGNINVTLMSNYFLPLAGIGFRAFYLNRVHGLSLERFSSTVVAIYVAEFVVFGWGGTLGLYWLDESYGQNVFFYAMLGIAMGFTSLALVTVRVPLVFGKFARVVNEILSGWYAIRRNSRVVVGVFAMTVAEFLLYAAMCWAAFFALSVEIDLRSVLFLAGFSDFSFFLKLAPGSLGTFEASVVYAASLQGQSIGEGIILAELLRFGLMVWFLTLGPIFMWMLSGTIRSVNRGGVHAYHGH